MTEFNVVGDAMAAAVYLSKAKLRFTENIHFSSSDSLWGKHIDVCIN